MALSWGRSRRMSRTQFTHFPHSGFDPVERKTVATFSAPRLRASRIWLSVRALQRQMYILRAPQSGYRGCLSSCVRYANLLARNRFELKEESFFLCGISGTPTLARTILQPIRICNRICVCFASACPARCTVRISANYASANHLHYQKSRAYNNPTF